MASQLQLGKMYARGDAVPRDSKLAAEWIRKAAKTGQPEPKTALAMLHLQDDEATRDPSQAEELLKEAAEGGDSAAAMQLGHLYSGKYAVVAEPEGAISWYTKAAEAGNVEAQYTLGMLHLIGRGVKVDFTKGANWIENSWRFYGLTVSVGNYVLHW